MIRIYVVLLVVGATTASPSGLPKPTPPYVQARELYNQAKFIVQNNLPLKSQDIHDPAERQHQGYAVLVGALNDLVENADKGSNQSSPILVVDKSIPRSLTSYLSVATAAQAVVSNLELKVKVVTDYIDSACGANSVQQCNQQVDKKVDQYPSIYSSPAKLLLELGDASKLVVNNEENVQEMTKDHGEISYLLNNADSPELQNLVQKLLQVSRTARSLQNRKSSNQ